MSMNMSDNQRQIIHNEEVVEAGQPEQTVVRQTQSSAADPTMGTIRPAPEGRTVPPTMQSTVQSTTATEAPSSQVVQRTANDVVVDPAEERAATVDWISRVVWF